ncbi:histone deacetylase HDT2-like isoform X2 [Ananas comosus]|uniref:Histone deacetylase HDT2-like isoform X2 n=1 Tax=Ananas comosus TaxID=4615 RepID=A0A6P5GFE0_ANACO|nr:histone deacetylase HDT2-like isoform X2 [Ananas comosus]
MQMESWAVEVKPGETFKCDPQRDNYVYLMQASLGNSKKEGAENVQIFLKFGDLNLVIGTLSAEKWPQILYNLLFEKKFELSHNSKNASVFFFGQKTLPLDASDSDDDDELSVNSASADDNDVQAGQIANVVEHETRKPKQEEADEIVELEKPSYPKNLDASKESGEDSSEEYSSEEYSSEGDSFGEYDSQEDSQLRNDSEDEEEIDENESSEEDAAITSKLDNRIKRLSPREQSAFMLQ